MPARTFLAGGGAMGALMRTHDWSVTPLGPPQGWPQPLRTLVGVMLTAKQPMFVVWGPDRTLLYNDAYAAILAVKHPDAMGRDFLEVWGEIRSDLMPIVEEAYAGRAVHMDDIALVMERRGYPEETHFSFSYTPVHNEAGRVAGFFCPCTETTEVVLAERRRVVERERLARMFDQAPGFIAMLSSSEHVFDLANVAYRRLIGGRDVIGLRLREALPDLAGQGFYELLDKVYQSGERHVAGRVSIRLQNAPGLRTEERVLNFIYEPVRDADGTVTGIFVEGQDVTESVRAEAELRASEERARRIVEGVKDYSVFVTDAAGEVMDWTPGAEAIFGWPENEIVGRHADLLFTLEDREAGVPTQELATARATGYAPDERWHLRRDGSTFFANGSVRPLHDAKGQVTGFIKIARDDTERRAVDAALRASEARLRELNDTLEARVVETTTERNRIWSMSRDLFAVMGFDGHLKAINPAWEATLGFDEATLLARPFPEQVHLDDHASIEAVMEVLLRGESVQRFEDRLQHADGSWRWISWSLVPHGDIFYAVGRDVTAEKKWDAELAAAQEALRQSQKMESMGQLTGGVAHDFNNLLTPIIGSLDRLVTRGLGNEREQRLMAGALESAERAKVLVQRLLAFARRQPLQPVAVDVKALVEGMAGLLVSTLGPTIDVRVDIEEELPPALADANQLEMALLNLAVNARDAMPDGGQLTIVASRASVRASDGSGPTMALRLGHYVRLSVTDTGSGMDKATLARAIEPFFSTKGIGRGTGLGLSMVHGLAAQLGGALTIKSEPDRGTTVELWLPLSTVSVDEAEANPPAQPATTSRGRALLVDDEDLVRMSTADMLTDLGFDVIEVGSAEEALGLIRDGQGVDLLVTDHLMPGMNGADLAREVQSLRPGLPVLIVSGYAEVEGIAPDLPRLVKPFRVAELAEQVATLMP